MKLLMEPIAMETRAGEPLAFCWRQRAWRVQEIAQRWQYRGRWWLDVTLHGEMRRYYRLACVPGRRMAPPPASPGGSAARQPPPVLDVEVFECAGAWTLSRLLD